MFIASLAAVPFFVIVLWRRVITGERTASRITPRHIELSSVIRFEFRFGGGCVAINGDVEGLGYRISRRVFGAMKDDVNALRRS